MKPVYQFLLPCFLCGSVSAQQKIDNEYVALQILQGPCLYTGGFETNRLPADMIH